MEEETTRIMEQLEKEKKAKLERETQELKDKLEKE